MLTKLRLSLTKQIEFIEQNAFATIILYGLTGYLTISIIAIPLSAYRNGELNWFQILLIVVFYFFLLFFYYTRYRMIVDDKDDN